MQRLSSALRIIAATAILLITATAPTLAQALPGSERDRDFDGFVRKLDLENPAYHFIYKGKGDDPSGGSSVGFHVAEPGRRKSGTFIPYNASNDPEAEVVTYRLARFLGVSHIYNPVDYYTLGPAASKRFRTMLSKRRETVPARRENHANILAEFNKHPNELLGAYRHKPKGRKYVVNALGMEGQLNTWHQLAVFVRGEGAMPTTKPMSIPGVRGQRPDYPRTPVESELELARQLSIILTIDQLTGQWDRFFENLEAYGDANGRLQLFSRDNGGAQLFEAWDWFQTYQRWVSRYDRETISKLGELNGFLQKQRPNFGDYIDVADWQKAAGFLKTESFETFKKKLEIFIDKLVPEREKRFGQKAYFPAKQSDTAGAGKSGVPIR